MSKLKAIILDVDGTLCDVREVRHHVNPKDPRFSGTKRFDRFHAESVNCPANESALAHYRRAKEAGWKILVVTARMTQWRSVTVAWLNTQGIEYDELYMREDHDHRNGALVKSDILDEIEVDHEVMEAVDDDPRVIKMWKQRGIKTHLIPGWET